MTEAPFKGKLDSCADINCIWALVKRAVSEFLGRERGGISLGLQKIPEVVLAYHIVGTNLIVINKDTMEKIRRTHDKRDYNAYLFYILLHEYLHTLGYESESYVRKLAYRIARRFFGLDHPVTLIARRGPHRVFPSLRWASFRPPTVVGSEVEILPGFRDTTDMYRI